MQRDLANGHVGLYWVGDDGFMLVRKKIEAGHNVLFVWMLYSRELWERFGDYVEEMDRMARAWSCDVIRFQSSRRGWKRSPWVKEVAAIFERQVKA